MRNFFCLCSLLPADLQEAIMSWAHVQANWKQFQRHVKLRRDRLTDGDIARIKGHRDMLIACLQERYGYAHDRAQREAREWEHHP
jgi:uncharacterized protein YjbJ (UPF0337 family)